MVDGKNPEMLLRVLADRQRLVDRLTKVDRELEPIRNDWREISQSLPPVQRQQVQHLISNTQEILAAILAQDERDTKTLGQQQQVVAREIRGASSGKRINQAYSQDRTTGGQSRYLDTHTE